MVFALESLLCLSVLAVITVMLVASLSDVGASTRIVTCDSPITAPSNQLPAGFAVRCDSDRNDATVKSM